MTTAQQRERGRVLPTHTPLQRLAIRDDFAYFATEDTWLTAGETRYVADASQPARVGTFLETLAYTGRPPVNQPIPLNSRKGRMNATTSTPATRLVSG